MAELGIALDGRAPLSEIEAQARAAEEGGAATLWIACHLFLRDPVSLAAVALGATTRVRVALMAMSPYSIHPVLAAMAAATLNELYPGRVLLSLGQGAPADLAAAGLAATRPIRTLREAILLCRDLFAGETVRFAGEVFGAEGRRLANPAPGIPIVLAASGPQMLRLAGAAADGVLISAATSPPFMRWCLEEVERAAAGRRVKRYGIVYARIGAEAKPARDKARRILGFILRGAHHARNLELAGTALDQAALRAAYAAEDWATVERLVDDEVVRRHTACGTAEEARARLAEYRAAGLDEIVLGGLTEPDEIARTFAALR
jgi:5,10-methylenetetrahydromethanopterin reductase